MKIVLEVPDGRVREVLAEINEGVGRRQFGFVTMKKVEARLKDETYMAGLADDVLIQLVESIEN